MSYPGQATADWSTGKNANNIIINPANIIVMMVKMFSSSVIRSELWKSSADLKAE